MIRFPTCIYSYDEKWSARPSTSLLHKLHNYRQETKRWIAVIKKKYYIALGDPIRSSSHDLYLPESIIDEELYGEELFVEYHKAEEYPCAKKIVMQVLSEEKMDEMLIRDFLEQPLSELGVLQEGQVLRIPALGLSVLVEKTEPSGVPVFLDGHEIGFEIQWPFVKEEEEQEKPIERVKEEIYTPIAVNGIVNIPLNKINTISKEFLTRSILPESMRGSLGKMNQSIGFKISK